MNRAEAKREVCGHLLAIISASMTEEIIHNINDYDDADRQRMEDALEDLQRELHRRANKR